MGIGEIMDKETKKKVYDFLRENGLFYDEKQKSLKRLYKADNSITSYYTDSVKSGLETLQDALKWMINYYGAYKLETAKTIVEMHEIANRP